MGLVTQESSARPFSPLAPFTSVATATVRPLKAITAAELATLREGDIVYTTNLRDYWKWLPLSAITSDDITYCAPTVVGAGLGRFERLLLASPDWKLQTAWFIDSTAANNEGDGSGGSPLQSDVELGRRWGQGPVFTSPITVTYLQSPTTLTNLNPICGDGGSVTFLGTRTVDKTVVLTAITTQNRGTNVRWGITSATLGAADVNKICIITASGTPANVGAYARILKDNGGGNVTTSPFGTFSVTTPFGQVTPQVGDTVQVVTLTTLTLGNIDIKGNSQTAPQDVPVRQAVIFDSLLINGGASLRGRLKTRGTTVYFVRSIPTNITIVGDATSGAGSFDFCGGGIDGVFCLWAFANVRQSGIVGTGFLCGMGSNVTFLSDTYFQNSTLQLSRGAMCNSQGIAVFDRTVNGAIIIFGGATLSQTTAIADWGTNNTGYAFLIRSFAYYGYVTKPTINGGLGVGRETSIGGTDKQYAAVPYIEGANNATFVLFT